MNAQHIPPTVIDSLTAAYHAIETALTRADEWNRAVVMSDHDRQQSQIVARLIADVRFRLGDLIAGVSVETAGDTDTDSNPFGHALERDPADMILCGDCSDDMGDTFDAWIDAKNDPDRLRCERCGA